jgi:hypothetical protein
MVLPGLKRLQAGDMAFTAIIENVG